jgi:hypothetical protein
MRCTEHARFYHTQPVACYGRHPHHVARRSIPAILALSMDDGSGGCLLGLLFCSMQDSDRVPRSNARPCPLLASQQYRTAPCPSDKYRYSRVFASMNGTASQCVASSPPINPNPHSRLALERPPWQKPHLLPKYRSTSRVCHEPPPACPV